MDTLVVRGGKPLFGDIDVSGCKNAAVAILPAAILCDEICRIENVPNISDVRTILKIMEKMGAKITYPSRGVVEIDSRNINSFSATYELVRNMRASYYLVGALLGKFNKAIVAMPGGCNFGERPIDQHMKGFEALGASVSLNRGVVDASAEELKGGHVYLDVVSVGATLNIMIAAAKADGMTVIENAAKEPHIVDAANFLNSMGADIKGAGTDTIKIRGAKYFRACSYSLIPDQIEAGTFMLLAAGAGGDVLIKNVIPKHMEAISAKLVEMGVTVEEFDDSIRVSRKQPLCKANIKTLPYPGFPTDMQPQAVALLTMAKGTSIVTEGVWDSRFQYIDELRRMGSNIVVNGRMAVIEGVQNLQGAPVNATDLRAGAGLVIAGIMAEGETVIYNVKHIDRGYESIEDKLSILGADIKRVNAEEVE